MGIPEEIRTVPRPKNTVVVASGNGYRVRQRTGCRNVDGRRVPVNGPYIGSIIDGRFVPDDPIPRTGSSGRVDIKSYGRVKMCDVLNCDILEMLKGHYNGEESVQIYCMAMIQACYPGVRDYQMKRRYDESFLSEMYPGVPMGKNDVSREQRNLGLEYSRIKAFMRDRVCSLNADDTLVIDGCLRQNHSRVDTFSKASRKTSSRKHKDTLMMYAFSLDLHEPVCSKIYQGNTVDSRAVSDFIESNGITKGLIVADKGFPYSAISDAVEKNKDLHYLLPLKRNSLLIDDHDMYSFDRTFQAEGPVECKMVECDGFWLYSFRDLGIATEEEAAFLEENKDDVDPELLATKRLEFGTVVFQSDLEAPPSKIYDVYMSRWTIELLFKFFETELDMDDTRVHDDYSDIGSDFVDYLAALMASRMANRFGDLKETVRWTFKASLDFLEGLKMVRIDDSDEWEANRIAEVDAELFAKLGVIAVPVVPKIVGKKGRPKGRKDSVPRKPRSDKGVRRSSSARSV